MALYLVLLTVKEMKTTTMGHIPTMRPIQTVGFRPPETQLMGVGKVTLLLVDIPQEELTMIVGVDTLQKVGIPRRREPVP